MSQNASFRKVFRACDKKAGTELQNYNNKVKNQQGAFSTGLTRVCEESYFQHCQIQKRKAKGPLLMDSKLPTVHDHIGRAESN